MEGSYRPNDVQIEYSMFSNSNDTAIMSPETFRMVYFAYRHSIMSYGIIFGGNQQYSDKIFKIQKRKFKNESFMWGTVQKIRNTTLIFSIYLLNVNICYKK